MPLFGKKDIVGPEVIMEDPTAWMLENSLSEFLLMPGGVLYMCTLGYTFLVGHKIFKKLGNSVATSHKFVSMLMACTGGGILVPIFLNGVPVPLANDVYPIAIIISFLLHSNFPILREVLDVSKIVKVIFIVFYETTRASVVMKLTIAAAAKIAPSVFSFPLFGPIFCGTIAGCGGGFLPFDKGLSPIKDGLVSPAKTAFIGATSLHLFLNTSMSDGCINAKSKAQVYLALFFIAVGVVEALGLSAKKEKVVKTKKE